MDVDAVFTALAAATANVTDLNGKKLHTYDYPADDILLPAWVIEDFDINPYGTMGGRYMMTVRAKLLVGGISTRAAFKMLAKMVSETGAGSVLAALEAARGAPGQLALSGAADDLSVEKIGSPGRYTFGENQYLGVEYTIEVIGS